MAENSGVGGLCGQVQRCADITYVCSYCAVRKQSLNKYLYHLQFHQHSPDFHVTCNISGCPRSFSVIDSLRRHIRRKHSQELSSTPSSDNQSEGEQEIGSDNEYQGDICSDTEDTEPPVISSEVYRNDLRRHLALFILKLHEKFGLQKSVQETLVDDIRHLFNLFTRSYGSIVSNSLKTLGITLKEQNEIECLHDNDDFFDDILRHVRSSYQLTAFCKSEFGLVEPIEIELGVNDLGKKDTFQYVPLLALLKKVLSVEDIQLSIHRQAQKGTSPNILSDFTDGTFYQNHRIFCENPDALRLHLYNDEFEVVNPLGAKRGKHKVSAFYFVIGNIEQRYRSQLRNIHLLAIVKDSLIKKYSFGDILKPLLKDLHILQTTGIDIKFDGLPKTIYGAVATITCDNLSAHSLGGFRSCFNSGRICRFCLALHTDINYKFDEADFTIRTRDIHQYHLSAIQENVQNGALVYGVVRKCPFEELDYFHTTEAFPPDVMHDFLEGVVPALLKQLLKVFHKERLVSIQTFNKELKKFHFGLNDNSSRPVEQKETILRDAPCTITGSASQKLCLFLKLPLIIGPYIPNDNKYWKLYLSCREICDVILAPRIDRKWIHGLEGNITDFLHCYHGLFPGCLTPKFHYLLHYPRLILAYGPIRLIWCMRFEAKHQYFKKIATKLHNFKNVAQSFATRHQMKQCWELASVDVLKQDTTSQGGAPVMFASLSCNVQSSVLSFCNLELSDIESADKIWKVRSITVDHVKYSTGSLFVIDLVHEEDIPVFFRITHCIRFRNSWLLCGRIYFSVKFSNHYHGYVVQDSGETIVLSPGQELDHQSIDVYTTEDGDQVAILHYLPCKKWN